MPTCPECGAEQEDDSLSSSISRPVRRSAFGTDWLSGDARVKDSTIEEIALSVIYFNLHGDNADDYIHEQVEARVPSHASQWEVEKLIQLRVHTLKEKKRLNELERTT